MNKYMNKYKYLLTVLFSCMALNVFAYDQAQQICVDKAKALDLIYRKRAFNSAIPLPTQEQLNFTNFRFQGRDPVDLSGLTLTNAVFDYADLTKVNLNGANLTGASLKNAFLASAKLESATLISTDFTNAHLESASLAKAYIDKAIFINANLTGAAFGSCTGMGTSAKPTTSSFMTNADMYQVTGLTDVQKKAVLAAGAKNVPK